ncbi:hypothetical protein SADUNF_Sadunf11G0070500 [Salix dunnii]|uniref:Uncharacterized protein n=1 Tax=Salix dunnii TaxID=1413687 RepID=A0A835MTB3_9ROSI|nr:hypothetical protein SADUNF_Sadunf11G0070500 [Salix dunnii]
MFSIRKHERSHMVQFSKSPLNWSMGAPPGSPRAPGEAKRDTFTFEFHRSGYATQEPHRVASLVGPWAESEEGCRTTVRCTSMEPADMDNPMTTHAPPRTRNNNPDE